MYEHAATEGLVPLRKPKFWERWEGQALWGKGLSSPHGEKGRGVRGTDSVPWTKVLSANSPGHLQWHGDFAIAQRPPS